MFIFQKNEICATGDLRPFSENRKRNLTFPDILCRIRTRCETRCETKGKPTQRTGLKTVYQEFPTRRFDLDHDYRHDAMTYAKLQPTGAPPKADPKGTPVVAKPFRMTSNSRLACLAVALPLRLGLGLALAKRLFRRITVD